MKKICLVALYFGKLPDYFKIWMKGCEYNSTIDFLLITDNKIEYSIPSNIKIINKRFYEVKEMIQKKFDFKISLDKPYKLCDYKPSYGEVFQEYLKGYDFWGHCDIDLFFGNIRRYITDEILDSYDRILTRGHFSLYRNTEEFNCKYRIYEVDGCQSYREVYTSNKSCCYDEWAGHCGNGISEIFKRVGIRQYDEIIYADLKFLKYSFKLAQIQDDKSKYRIFIFDRGEIFAYSIIGEKLVKENFMYCHFQKRNPVIKLNEYNGRFMFIPPNIFMDYTDKDIDIIELKKLTKRKYMYWEPVYFYRNKVKKIISRVF